MKVTIKPKITLVFVLASFLIAATTYLAYRGYMNYQGYCWEEQRYIDKEEKIRRSIQRVLYNYPPGIYLKEDEKDGVNNGYKPDQPIFYKNVEHFIQENPDCCQWKETTAFDSPEADVPSFLEKVTGKNNDYVRVRYAVRFIKNGQYRSEPDVNLFGLSSCAIPRLLNK